MENAPTIQEPWSFTDMVRHGDENGVEALCIKFTVNEKWLNEIDFFKPSYDITTDNNSFSPSD